MFDIVDTSFSYGRGLVAANHLAKDSILCVIENVDTAFLLCGADM